MKTSTALAIGAILTVVAALYSAFLYSRLPEMIPTHWNASGQADAWGHKGPTLFMFPLIMLAMTSLTVVLPWLSPKNFKIDAFRGTFNEIMAYVLAMFAYLHFVIMWNTAHPEWNGIKAVMGGIFFFIGLIGNLLGKVKPNFYVGIRTPWTLASEKVWTATHRLGARLMFIAGMGGAILVLLGVPPMPVFVLFMAAVLYPVLYSFLLYKKLESHHVI